MSKKIYLSPSNQEGNLYAAGNTNEMEQCNRIAEAAKKALERCGFTVKKAPKGQEMSKSIAESNNWGADLHIPIHTNAGGGNGTVVFVYQRTAANLAAAEPIYQAVQAVTPGKTDYGVRAFPELAELNSTRAVAVYVEADFHDDKEIAKWLVEHPQEVGEAIAKGVCKAYQVSYRASSGTSAGKPAAGKPFYRIQVGAFSDKANAQAYLKKVQQAGFSDAFITTVTNS